MTPLSLAHLSELDTPPQALAAMAGAAGFASIGLRMMAAVPGGTEYRLRDAAGQGALRRACAAAGVSVLYAEMIGLSGATDLADCARMVEAAAAIGATRIAVSGDDPDHAVVADRMAAICALARPHGMAVDLEFMRFRAVRTLGDALAVARRTGAANAHVLLDALHFFRAGGTAAALRGIDPTLLGTVQLCDAPAGAPADLAAEARTARLFPGEGGLDLRGFIAALPPGIPLGVELPIAARFPDLAPAARIRLMAERTREFLATVDLP